MQNLPLTQFRESWQLLHLGFVGFMSLGFWLLGEILNER